MTVAPFVPWHPCSRTANFAGISQVRSFVTQTTAPFQVINLTPSSGAVYLSVVWTLNAVKVIAFALEQPALRQRVFPMHRFALLADGNLMLLSSLLGILTCQLSSFYDISLGQTRAAKHRFLLYCSSCLLRFSHGLCIFFSSGSVSLMIYYLFVSYVSVSVAMISPHTMYG